MVSGDLSTFDEPAFKSRLGAALVAAPADITLTLAAASVAVAATVRAPADDVARVAMLLRAQELTASPAAASAVLSVDVEAITSAAAVVNGPAVVNEQRGGGGLSPGVWAAIGIAIALLLLVGIGVVMFRAAGRCRRMEPPPPPRYTPSGTDILMTSTSIVEVQVSVKK